jgi:hypothetical protein
MALPVRTASWRELHDVANSISAALLHVRSLTGQGVLGLARAEILLHAAAKSVASADDAVPPMTSTRRDREMFSRKRRRQGAARER